ncbi:DUF859 family phage minor structural protein [Streptococcus fryi]
MRKRIINTTNYSDKYVDMDVSWHVVSRDEAQNRSTGKLKVTLYASDEYTLNSIRKKLKTRSITVGGRQLLPIYFDSNSRTESGPTEHSITFYSFEETFVHNEIGELTAPVNMVVRNESYMGEDTVVFDFRIVTQNINRASVVSTSGDLIGGALSIGISRKHNLFKHNIRYEVGNQSGGIANNVDTSYRWTIPTSIATQFPNSTQGSLKLYVDCLYNGKKFATVTHFLQIRVPDTMVPTFSGVTLTDKNGTARQIMPRNNFIQIISDIQVAFSGASGINGSSIISYRAEIVGRSQTISSNNAYLGIMNWSGNAVLRAWVIDSRGRTSAKRDFPFTVHAYKSPALTFKVQRTGAKSDILSIYRTAQITPLTVSGVQKNTMTLNFKTALKGSSQFTSNNSSASGSWTNTSQLTNSLANLSGTFPLSNSYTVLGTLSDRFHSVEFQWVVGTEQVVMSYDKDGRVGIGKVAELGKAGSLDVAGDIYSGGHAIQIHPLTGGNPALGYLDRFDIDSPKKTGFGWGLISRFFSSFNSNGVIQTFFTNDKEATQIWTAHTGRAQFGRYRSWSNGDWGELCAVGIDNFYPVGSLYLSTNNTNPSTFMGGTWVSHSNSNGIYYFKRTE